MKRYFSDYDPNHMPHQLVPHVPKTTEEPPAAS
jgi:hypothetical protein